jgi:hypothetical protein
LHVSKQPEAAVPVIHKDVLPIYHKVDLPVRAVLTNGREFCGTQGRRRWVTAGLVRQPIS